MLSRRIYFTLAIVAIIALAFYSCKKPEFKFDPSDIHVRQPDSTAVISNFVLPYGQLGNAVITKGTDSLKIVVYVKDTLDLTKITPTVTISA